MWNLIKSELEYNSLKSVAYLAVIPILVFIEINFGQFPKLYIALLLYFVIFTWFLNRNKEKREIIFNKLPLPKHTIAISRTLIVFLFAFLVYLIYRGFYWILDFNSDLNFDYIYLSILFVLIVFFISFLVRDLTFDFFRRIGLNKYNVKFVLMILILAINIVTVYAYIFTKSKGRSPVFFETVIHFLEINNPFLHPEAALYFSIACFGAALLTVYAYNKRKSYLE